LKFDHQRFDLASYLLKPLPIRALALVDQWF